MSFIRELFAIIKGFFNLDNKIHNIVKIDTFLQKD
jgi:hypothetical protein